MSHQTAGKRKYELKQRAAEMAETRRRIIEAAIELHGSVGPARTTMTAVAERAGVERRTLYRHFATDAELFEACSNDWFAANPRPDVAAWRAIGEVGEVRAAGFIGVLGCAGYAMFRIWRDRHTYG